MATTVAIATGIGFSLSFFKPGFWKHKFSEQVSQGQDQGGVYQNMLCDFHLIKDLISDQSYNVRK